MTNYRLHFGLGMIVHAVLATGCLQPDYSKACGPNEPCFQGEVCLEGKCVASSATPSKERDGAAGGDARVDSRTDAMGVDTASSSDVGPGLDAEAGATGRKGPGESCGDDSECLGPCRAGTCAHRIFISATPYTGDLGGVSGADSTCGRLAGDENLGGSWRALLLENRDYQEPRIAIAGPVVNRGDETVFRYASDFPNSRVNPVRFDAAGDVVHSAGGEDARDMRFWTGWSSPTTGASDDCGGWRKTSVRGKVGFLEPNQPSQWLNGGSYDCYEEAHLVCISQ